MENSERSGSLLSGEKDTKIQLVMNSSDSEETTIDLGRVFHNMKLKSRIFSWVLVLCLVVGVCAPLLLYQFTKDPLKVTSVVTLRYDVPAGKKGLLVAPDGSALDLTTVTSSTVLQKALDGLALSHPVTIENLRSNITITRVLTDESSRTREILAGLADAKNVEVYKRLESTKLNYQNRFIVSLSNHFGDEEARVKFDLKDEELRILLNRILDAYNDTLIRQYANVRLPEDKVALIDTEILDIPEVLDSLSDALESLLDYCSAQPEAARVYRSWQTGLSLEDWMNSIRTIQSVSIDYLDAFVYAQGLIRDKEAVALTYRYRLRTLQNNLEKINQNIADTEVILKNYKNNEVLVSMQESGDSRATKVTTEYYNSLVLQLQSYFVQAAGIRTRIAETQNNLDRLGSVIGSSDLQDVEREVTDVVTAVQSLQDGIRSHMDELFESSLYTTYSEHSVPQGKEDNFLKASLKKIIIGVAGGLVIGCGLWFLAGLAPEFRRGKEKDPDPRGSADGKEAAEA